MADADFNVKAIISAQTSQFEKGLKNAQSSINTMSKSIEGVQKLLKNAFSVVGIGMSIKAVADFGKSCVQSATQAQKAFNILDNTVRATGADAWTSIGELENASKSLSDSTNYSVTEIQKMQSVLLGFTNITGEAFDGASEAVLDMATVMGMDLTSAVQTIGKALDDPITGLDSLRRQGFKFTDEQKAELGQLVKNGKQYEAQKIILDTLATSYGGAAAAGQDSFARQRHAVENFQDTLGGKLIPVMQVFAQNNANMINSLTKLISELDFTPLVNIITNLSNIFNSAFNNIKESFKNVKTNVKEFISAFNFEPVIKILDVVLGSVFKLVSESKSRFSEMKETVNGAIKNISEKLIEFSNSPVMTKIVDFVNTAVNAFWFLYDEVKDLFSEISKFITDKVIEVWNKIKELFENSQTALENSGTDITNWSDLFYNTLNNVFKIFQDFINMVKAIFHGDWAVAWEYAKLTVMRIADNILDILSTIMNAFPEMVNGLLDGWNWIIKQINKARKFFGEDPLNLAGTFEPKDLSKETGLEEKIEQTENKIKELTGKAADYSIQDLKDVTSEFSGFTSRVLGKIEGLTEGTEKEAEKQRRSFSTTTTEGENSYEKFSEWDSKLLQQRLEGLKDWSDEAHKINLDLIEQERKKAHEADTTGAETLKIDEYYNKQIEKENERSEKAKRNMIKQTTNEAINQLKNVASKSVEVFKKVVSTIKNAFSAIGNFIKSAFSGLTNIFSKLFDFNIDETLDNILKVEDSILTFFVETLPKLPSFFESAFSSVLKLIQSLINSVNWEDVKGVLNSIVNTFISNAPKIVDGIINIFTSMVKVISETLVNNSNNIINAIAKMFFSVIDALPAIISNFIKVLGTYISEIGKYFADNSEKITGSLTSIIKSIVEGVNNFIKNGGWKNLLNGILSIQKSLENVVKENLQSISDTIISMLPDLVQTLIDSIVSASKTLGEIAKVILPLIAKIINAIVDVITSDEVIESSIEAIEGIVEGLIPAIVDICVNAIPKIITFILVKIPKYIPKLISGIIKGLVNGFKKIEWDSLVKEIFNGFIDSFRELFGIHSPSTLFEGFGVNMIEGLKIGLETSMNLIYSVLETLKSLFSISFDGLNESITRVFSGFAKIIEITTSMEGLRKLLESINNIMRTVGKTTISVFGVIGQAIASFHNAVRDAIYSMTSISVYNPFNGQTYTIGGIDIGKVTAPDMTQYLNAFENGTNNAKKGLALVGEAGPELVNFKGGEQVLNTKNTQKALSAQNAGNTFNVTFNNLQDTSAYTMMNQLKRYNREMAINGIL